MEGERVTICARLLLLLICSTIWSFNTDGGDQQVEKTNVDVVGLFPSSTGLLYIDYYANTITNLDVTDALASPDPIANAFAVIVPQQLTWTPGQAQALSFDAITNIGVREGRSTTWGVALRTACSNTDACTAIVLIATGLLFPDTIAFPAPPGELRKE